MPSAAAPPLPPGRYSPWFEKSQLEYADDAQFERASTFLKQPNLSSAVRDALYFRELTGSSGLEFVAIGNVRLTGLTNLECGALLLPCFYQGGTQGTLITDPLAALTLRMEANGRFVYDGWLPISDWTPSSLQGALENLAESLLSFAGLPVACFEWHLKYSGTHDVPVYVDLSTNDVLDSNALTKFLATRSPSDRKAALRSLGWLMRARATNEPSAKVVFCVAGVEVLAKHIEKGDSSAGILGTLRKVTDRTPEEQNRAEQRVRELVARAGGEDFEATLRKASSEYFEAQSKVVETHVRRLLGDSWEVVDLLFVKRPDGLTLYGWRNRIAHGGMDNLSQKERDDVSRRVYDADRALRLYLKGVLGLIGAPSSRRAVSVSQWHAPVDMIALRSGRPRPSIHLAHLYA